MLNDKQKIGIGATLLLIVLNICAYFSFFEKKDPLPKVEQIIKHTQQLPNPAELYEQEQAKKEEQIQKKNNPPATLLNQKLPQKITQTATDTIKDTFSVTKSETLIANKAITAFQIENLFIRMGLVNIQEYDNSIVVNLRYGTTNNFTKADLYGGLKNAYCLPEVAKKLSKAQEYLKEQNPQLSLLILDAARPQRTQETMWEIVKNTPNQKYVAPPTQGSLHTYGAAIDLTLANQNGTELDMGTPYDSFTDLAQPQYEKKMVVKGKLKTHQLNNRLLLRDAMRKAGFTTIEHEWWHFDAYSLKTAKNKFKLIP